MPSAVQSQCHEKEPELLDDASAFGSFLQDGPDFILGPKIKRGLQEEWKVMEIM